VSSYRPLSGTDSIGLPQSACDAARPPRDGSLDENLGKLLEAHESSRACVSVVVVVVVVVVVWALKGLRKLGGGPSYKEAIGGQPASCSEFSDSKSTYDSLLTCTY